MSGGSSNPVPTAYAPTGNATADSNIQSLNSNAMPYATALPGQVIPQLQQTAGAVMNNPYTAGLTTGNDYSNPATGAVNGNTYNNTYGGSFMEAANDSSDYLRGTVVPGMQSAAAGLNGFGQGQLDFSSLLSGLAPGLIQAAFDPQRAVYDQNYSRNMDSTNAILAMNGVAGSPYAAGVAGQSVRDFNNDWNDRQLARQLSGIQGLGDIGSAMSGAGSSASGAFGDSAQLGAGAADALYTAGQQPYATYNAQFQDRSAANQQAYDAYNQQYGDKTAAMQSQSDAYNAQRNNDFQALMAMISGTQGALAPGQDLASSLGNYLGIGQAATTINQNARKQQAAESGSLWSGLGKLAGTAGGFLLGGPAGAKVGGKIGGGLGGLL